MNQIWRFINNERFLFSLVLLFEFAFSIWLVVQKRIPSGHDSFQYFTLQYYFLNNLICNHEIPQWIPYMTQGTVATWWYAIQSSFMQNVFLCMGGLLKNVNFLYLFHANMFFDELILIVGCWFWSKKYLENILAVFFFTISVVGSSIWLNQVWYNFHFYYCLPLIFYFWQRFFETSLWRYFFLMGHLFIMQILGNLPYFIPVSSFIVFSYVVFYSLFHANQCVPFVQRLRLRIPFISSLLSLGVFLYLLYLCLSFGTDQIVNYNFGRTLHGTTNLGGFLTYAGGLNFNKWGEMVSGLSPELDYTLYCGLLIVPLAVWAVLFYLNRKTFVIALIVTLLLNFSIGGMVAKLVFHFWPLMDYYRHLALVAPIIKLFICLLAAMSFDRILEVLKNHKDSFFHRWKLYALCLFLLVILLGHLYVNWTGTALEFINHLRPSNRLDIRIYKEIFEPFVLNRLEQVFYLSAILTVFCFVYALVRTQWIKFLVILGLLTIQIVDVYIYKSYECHLRTLNVGPWMKGLEFSKTAYISRRSDKADDQNPRAQIIKHLPLCNAVLYWSNDPFIPMDEPGGSFRTDHWLMAFDQFLRTYWNQPIMDLKQKPKGLFYYARLDFPHNPIGDQLAGISEDKIQFYSDALYLSREETISSLMKDNQYHGKIPLILDKGVKVLDYQDRLSIDARLKIPYTIDDFGTNQIQVSFHLPNTKKAWLYYSDVWHPVWQATVNGKKQPIQRANLAYKIVQVDGGSNKVCFSFRSLPLQIAQFVLSLASLAWVLGVFFMIRNVYVRQGRIKESITF